LLCLLNSSHANADIRKTTNHKELSVCDSHNLFLYVNYSTMPSAYTSEKYFLNI